MTRPARYAKSTLHSGDARSSWDDKACVLRDRRPGSHAGRRSARALLPAGGHLCRPPNLDSFFWVPSALYSSFSRLAARLLPLREDRGPLATMHRAAKETAPPPPAAM